MLTDARSQAIGSVVEADICVVGAGPAGITIARGLASTGAHVLVLESGGTTFEKDLMKLTEGESVGHPYPPLFESRARVFGGTSQFWPEDRAMRARPLDPIDFADRSDIPYSGWPIDATELDRFYKQAQEIGQLGAWGYSAEDSADPDSGPVLDIAGEDVHTAMFRFAPGIEVFPGYLDELRASDTVEVMHHANVVELVSGTGDHVDHLEVVGLWNTAFQVRALIVVLAAGGIENARLLLASRGSDPAGLGNSNDLVGRFFMEHLHVQSGLLLPRDPALADWLGRYEIHGQAPERTVAVLVASEAALRREGILNNAVYLKPIVSDSASSTYRSLEVVAKSILQRSAPDDENLGDHLRNLARHPVDAARIGMRRLTKRSYGSTVVQLTIQGQQAPNPASRVTLSGYEDPLGFPKARLDWQLSDIDLKSIRGIQEILRDSLAASGLGRVEDLYGDSAPPPPIRGHWHHMGTTRMSTDSEAGVVDPNGRMHQVDNVYVAGSSVFPTGGYVNPTLTVIAMAARLAEHLSETVAG